jgi:hypothetical protein
MLKEVGASGQFRRKLCPQARLTSGRNWNPTPNSLQQRARRCAAAVRIAIAAHRRNALRAA